MHLSSAFPLPVSEGSGEDRSSISGLLVGKLRNGELPKVRVGNEPGILITWSLEIKVVIGSKERAMHSDRVRQRDSHYSPQAAKIL